MIYSCRMRRFGRLSAAPSMGSGRWEATTRYEFRVSYEIAEALSTRDTAELSPDRFRDFWKD
jgi:hypothetical protein